MIAGLTRVGFSRGPGWLSRAIRWATGSTVSHAFVVFWCPTFQRDMVLEAGARGPHVIPLDLFLGDNEVVAWCDPGVDLAPGLRAASGWLTERYDYPGLLGRLLVLAARRAHRTVRNPFRSDRAMVCSELVTRVLQASGVPGAGALDPEEVSPADLLSFLRPPS